MLRSSTVRDEKTLGIAFTSFHQDGYNSLGQLLAAHLSNFGVSGSISFMKASKTFVAYYHAYTLVFSHSRVSIAESIPILPEETSLQSIEKKTLALAPNHP